MNRKISVGMAVSIVILAMTVTFSITMLVAMRLFDSTVSSVKEKESMYNKIAEVDRYVRSNDYYPIDETTLYDRLTAGYLLGTGDKYARYFSATAYTELMNTQNGTLIGIGVELAVDQSGYAKVIKVYDESPAKEAGIQVGNYITAVDGTDVKSMSSVDAIQTRLRGESGTTVNVTWLDSEAAEHTADLTHSCASISSRTTALSGVSGLIRPDITPRSPMIAVMIGFTPADIATGIAMTGTIARDGIAPGPTAQIRKPSRYITNGISALCGPTSATIFFARSSNVPFSLMMAKR